MIQAVIKSLAMVAFFLALFQTGAASGQTVRQTFSDDGQLITSDPEGKKEEKLPEPLVDDEVKLIALSPDRSIFLAADRKSVVFLAEVCLREGPLEFFVCSKNSKEHESILSTQAKPSLIHVGLLAMGAEPGTPVQWTPEFAAATGPRIDITLRWLDKDGKRQEIQAEEWVQEIESKNKMSTHWVFAGSLFRKLEGGRNQYVADVTGEIVGVSNFPTVVLDLPIASTSDNKDLLFQAFTDKIPCEGTHVTIILSRYDIESH
ncbi:MAG: YdjY domain-containing protein [Planctomycetaceae bacterium]|nr:YdjY domain-containing protein [Planctomycetaceae bacterium]